MKIREAQDKMLTVVMGNSTFNSGHFKIFCQMISLKSIYSNATMYDLAGIKKA